jgi:hypothetical protein
MSENPYEPPKTEIDVRGSKRRWTWTRFALLVFKVWLIWMGVWFVGVVVLFTLKWLGYLR